MFRVNLHLTKYYTRFVVCQIRTQNRYGPPGYNQENHHNRDQYTERRNLLSDAEKML